MDIVIPSGQNLLLFVGAALVLLLIPGPAVLYVVARSITQGRKAGIVSVCGIHTATLIHILAAALGLSVLVLSSALAFNVVKYAGAAYLVWLGFRKLFGPAEALNPDGQLLSYGYGRLFRDGFIVNLLNPKTALFFIAFLPQFVDVSRGSVAVQITILGLLLAVLGFITDSAYSLLANAIGGRLKNSRSYVKYERYGSGLLFIGLGVTAAVSGAKK